MEMSSREALADMINQLPDNKIQFLITAVRGMLTEETEPDEWDLKMMRDIQNDSDDTYVSFEDVLKEEGLTYADLQEKNTWRD